MEFLKNLWQSRDELNVRNLRFANWNIVVLFALSVIMGDLRLVDLGEDASWLGLDSFTLEMMAYSLGILAFAFVPQRSVLQIARAGAAVMMLTLISELVIGDNNSLPLYLIYSCADGLCMGGALYLFFYYLNNDERLLNMVLIGLYYVVCVELLWESFSEILVEVVPFVLVALFLLCVFTIKPGRIPLVSSGKTAQTTQKSNDSVGLQGMAAVFGIYTIYMVIEMLYIYLKYDTDYILGNIFALGGFCGIALIVVVQLLWNRNVWYSWTIFLICALLSMGLFVLGGPFSVNAGSLLYGIAYILGYIAIMYLVGGAAALNGNLRYFRIFCVVEFVISFVFTPGLEYLFAVMGEMGTTYNLIALGVMVALICAVMALSPVLNNRVFSSDWVNGLVGVNPTKYGSQLARVEEAEKTEPVELATLTPRERDVLTLLLTDIAPKQIAHELKISTSTFNYHSTNLYRKLGVNSRIELIMRFNR